MIEQRHAGLDEDVDEAANDGERHEEKSNDSSEHGRDPHGRFEMVLRYVAA